MNDGDPAVVPGTWVTTTLGELLLPVTAKVEPSTVVGSIYLGLEHMGKGTGAIIGSGNASDVDSAKTVFNAGDVLYGKLRPYLNKVAVAPFDGICSTDILAFRPSGATTAKFILYRLLSRDFVEYANSKSNGVNLPRVDAKSVGAFEVLLPTMTEQQRIVSKIEELFSKLDVGIAELKRTQGLLKRYRQSLLHAAVTGELSRAWREENGTVDPDGETAERLLGRILDERRARWAADGRRGKYKEPAEPHTTGLPALPESWAWGTFEQLSDRVTVGFVGQMRSEYVEHGVPFLRSQNIRPNRFDRAGLKYVSIEFHKRIFKSVVRAGDIAVVRSGGVGATCVIPEEIGEANCSDLVLVQSPKLEGRFAAYFMNSAAQSRIKAGKVGIGLEHFNTASVASMAVPLPPLAEQIHIVTEVERRLSILDNMETTVAAELKRAESTRQSILHRAFTGQLVPHDPSDEPASVLLERIQAEKVKAGAQAIREGPRGRGRPRKATNQPELLETT